MATRHSTASREAILRAAAAVFAKRGYARARMVAIAQEAGISRAGLYKHFPGKAELLVALNEFVIDEWRAWLEDVVGGAPSSREAIERWLREGLADSWRVNAAQIVTSEEAGVELAASHRATREALQATHRTLARVLRRGIEAGELRRDIDVPATAHGLQAILLGLLRNQLADRPIVALTRTAEVDAVVELALMGLLEPRRRSD